MDVPTAPAKTLATCKRLTPSNCALLLESALEGARLRCRPIIMTSFAFILGGVPLWLACGSGGVARRVMGTTAIGGMVAATFITIFLLR